MKLHHLECPARASAVVFDLSPGRSHFWTLALMVCVLAAPLSGAAAADYPVINSAVEDRAGVLNHTDIVSLKDRILKHRQDTGVQVAVLVVDTTHGEPIEDFSMGVAEAWKGGAQGRDDGVLFVLALKDRRMRLELGYGIEPYISDVEAAQIINESKPLLKQKHYGTAILVVINGVIEKTRDIKFRKSTSSSPTAPMSGGVLFALLMLLGTGAGLCSGLLLRRARTQIQGTALKVAAFFAPVAALVLTALLVMGTAHELAGFAFVTFYGAAIIAVLGQLFGWWTPAHPYATHRSNFGIMDKRSSTPAVVLAWSAIVVLFIMIFEPVIISSQPGFPKDMLLAHFLGVIVPVCFVIFFTMTKDAESGSTYRGSNSSSSSSGSWSSSFSSSSSSSFGSSSRSSSSSFSSSSLSSFGSSSRSSSSSFGSSSSSFGSSSRSSSSSFGSSSRSSRSSSGGYSGGGGSFGGGGASGSW